MALKLNLDSLDGLDAALQPLYTKTDDGKFRLDAEGLDSIQAALKTANKEAADRRKALEGFKDVDPAEYQRLKSEAEERAVADATKKGEWEKLKDQMAQKHQQDILAKDNSLAKYRAALERNLIDAQAVTAIAAAKGVPELLLPHVKNRVKVEEVDGEFTFKILDAKGGPMIADAAGTPAGFSHLIESMKADPIFGRAFEGSGASGMGAPQGNANQNGTKTMARSAFAQLNPNAQRDFVKAGGVLTN
jgi:hypothetical protein